MCTEHCYILGTVLSAFHVSAYFSILQQLNDASTVYPSFTHEENEERSLDQVSGLSRGRILNSGSPDSILSICNHCSKLPPSTMITQYINLYCVLYLRILFKYVISLVYSRNVGRQK